MSLETLEARFWAKVEIAPGPNACWLWEAFTDRDGYGRMWGDNDRRAVGAHRVAYELFKGPIPEGLQIDHLCCLRRCVNPAHLEVVTPTENHRRGHSGDYQRVKTHCPRGHRYDDGKTYIAKNGGRVCRACHLAQVNAAYVHRPRIRCTAVDGAVRCRRSQGHDGNHRWWDAQGASNEWSCLAQKEYDRYEAWRDSREFAL